MQGDALRYTNFFSNSKNKFLGDGCNPKSAEGYAIAGSAKEYSLEHVSGINRKSKRHSHAPLFSFQLLGRVDVVGVGV